MYLSIDAKRVPSHEPKENKYNIIGIDIQNECVGNFITDTYLQCPRLDNDNYWEFIENIITETKKDAIDSVFEDNTMPVIDVSNMEKPKSKSND